MLFHKGDLILGETSAKFEDLYDYMNSLNKVMQVKPNVIYPGHGPVVENGSARIQQYIDHRNKRNEQILAFLKSKDGQPAEIEDMVKTIYEVAMIDIIFFIEIIIVPLIRA